MSSKKKLSSKYVEDFVFSGKAIFEIKKDKTKIVVKVEKGKNPNRCPNFDKIFFVKVLMFRKWWYVGHVKKFGVFKWKPGYISPTIRFKLESFFSNIENKDLGGWKVYHLNRCGHCGNQIYGEDLITGIGKSCRKELDRRNVQLELKYE